MNDWIFIKKSRCDQMIEYIDLNEANDALGGQCLVSSKDRAKGQATHHFDNANLITLNTQRSFPKSNPIYTERKSAQSCNKNMIPVIGSMDLCHGKN